MAAIIEIENLTHRFADGTVGLNDVSLEIAEGAFVVLAGANGSGKTTLLRHLNRLLRPTTGSVRIDGVRHRHRQARGHLPVSGQYPRRLVGLIRRQDIVRAYRVGISRRLDLQERPARLRLGKLPAAAGGAPQLRAAGLGAGPRNIVGRLIPLWKYRRDTDRFPIGPGTRLPRSGAVHRRKNS